jgi:hypothetical protein
VPTVLNAAKAACALIAMSVAFSVAVVAAPVDQAPQMTLLSTDTSAPYPFAAIVVNHQTYHVTVGDVLDGVYIRHISPGRVTLSDDHVLVAVQQPRQDSPTSQISSTSLR